MVTTQTPEIQLSCNPLRAAVMLMRPAVNRAAMMLMWPPDIWETQQLLAGRRSVRKPPSRHKTHYSSDEIDFLCVCMICDPLESGEIVFTGRIMLPCGVSSLLRPAN
ncbi:hypothetical protein EYF80_052380 [Liparis tanakae]|uniref:Uncharacterized protein n=1 Tax=Liparis tanakae TaxID=230148 RepID=A0A4Z2F8A7_9TELE|nr:hypothetical protein EYF80_052380 [Liparis tanakae]